MTITYAVHRAHDGTTTVVVDTGGRVADWTARITESGRTYVAGPSEAVRKLDKVECRDLLDALEQVRIPAQVTGAMGLDGSTYTLTLEAGFTAITLRWWLRLPEGWQTLELLIAGLARLDKPPRGMNLGH